MQTGRAFSYDHGDEEQPAEVEDKVEANIENEDVEHEEINAGEKAVEKRAGNGHDTEQRRRQTCIVE